MDETDQSSLESLLVDENALNEELLTDILREYIRIGQQSGEIIPKSEFQSLTTKEKTVVVLLAQRALAQLDMAESEWLKPSEISDIGRMKDGTVRPILKKLKGDLLENEDGKYRVPSYSFEAARSLVNGARDE
ncbi:hypothetical protein [Halogeometricum sp. CBA1124]|uniref:hypothetical protein n=1 Tax=Halogeometricum sp. CBA1124 TaxID=2668071 RepID=UPI001429DC46|nr:hypothetical protein [Halogeometricum sp. CBA1124]MUV56246.1 hypothetical protein [Halogeometricum sp. CBA1124]